MPVAAQQVANVTDSSVSLSPSMLEEWGILAADPERVHQLYQRVVSHFPCQEAFVSEFSPAIGVHIGLGLLVLAFYVGD